jgi:PIN domain nuclease of toxin-antitoxin system
VTVGESTLLLDTHTLLWWAAETGKLSRKARRLIESPEITVLLSAATAWEIATNVRLRKLRWFVASGA